MDFARGICIILVLLVHTEAALEVGVGDRPEPFRTFNLLFDPYRMPFLMFLSGVLLQRSLKKNLRDNFVGKFSGIFWPFLIWSMVIYVAEGRFDLITVLKTPISAPSLLWYLWFLFAYYIIMTVADSFRVPTLLMVVVPIVLSQFAPSFLRIDRFCYLLTFFALGHLYTTSSFGRYVTRPVALVALALCLVGSYISAFDHPIKYELLFAWAPIGLILFVTHISRHYAPVAPTRPIEWVGRNSIVFYVCHFPVEILFGRHILDGIGSVHLRYVLTFLAAVAAGVLLQKLRANHRIVAGLFDLKAALGGFRRTATASK